MKFNRIWVKVFLILAFLNVSLTLTVYLFNLWSFDRSLNQYLEEQKQQGLLRVAEKLADTYQIAGGWVGQARDPAYVERLVFGNLFHDRPVDHPPRSDMPPSSDFHRGLPMGLALLDARQSSIIGDPEPNALLIPVRVQGQTVGYLGVPPSRPLPQAVMQAFVDQQQQSFFLIAIGMLGASVLGAFGIARWFGRPIAALAQGTRQLSAGDCSVRLPSQSADELGQLARDFNVLAQTLAANRQSRREWIVNIAHELRTPLTVMLGEIEAIEDGVRQPDSGWHGRIGQKTRQLSVLVNDLHQLALSDQGAMIYHKTPLDLAGLVRELLDSHRFSFDHAGLQVDLEARESAPILGDVDRLRQLFGNLLQNTLRYTDMPGTLRIKISCVGSHVKLIWEDSAPGVPVADLDRLTERLYRGDSSRSRAAGGSGLGLSIAKAIVDAHEGLLQPTQSELGGLCWILQLPLAQELEPA